MTTATQSSILPEAGCPRYRPLSKTAYETWTSSKEDDALVDEVVDLAEQFGKGRRETGATKQLRREDLELICFEYVTG